MQRRENIWIQLATEEMHQRLEDEEISEMGEEKDGAWKETCRKTGLLHIVHMSFPLPANQSKSKSSRKGDGARLNSCSTVSLEAVPNQAVYNIQLICSHIWWEDGSIECKGGKEVREGIGHCNERGVGVSGWVQEVWLQPQSVPQAALTPPSQAQECCS